MEKATFKVLSLPAKGGPNPYISLFYNSLSKYGIKLVGRLIFNISWLKKQKDNFDAIHLHWPESLWRNYKGIVVKEIRDLNFPGSWKISNLVHSIIGEVPKNKRIHWFKNCLEFLKANNKKIIWTWHNAEPHEDYSDIDYLCNQILADFADLIIFHSKITEKICRKNYEINCKTIIMPHGNYYGVYPKPQEREEILEAFGFRRDFPVVGCLGGIREYKGIDLACEALGKLSDLNIQFICAGVPYPGYDLNKLSSIIAELEYSIIITREISNQEFSDFVSACDFLLLPYRKVSGSGALLAYLSLGRGVVAADLPYFKEVLSGSNNAGVLFKPNDSSALAYSIRQYLKISPENRSTSALSLADEYMWSKIVTPVANYIVNNFMN